MLIPVLLWSTLSIVFLWRLRTIMINITRAFTPGTGLLRIPHMQLRPLKQLAIWGAEFMMLATLYSVFGVSIIAHIVASIVCCGAMLVMHETNEPNWLRGLQLIPIASNVPFAA